MQLEVPFSVCPDKRVMFPDLFVFITEYLLISLPNILAICVAASVPNV